jgi:hypothetical protein
MLAAAAALGSLDAELPVEAGWLVLELLLLHAVRASAATAATDSALTRNFCRFTYPPQHLTSAKQS